MATPSNSELLALSAPRGPDPGEFGVVEEVTFADLLLVDGDPIANIKLIEDAAKNLVATVHPNVVGRGCRAATTAPAFSGRFYQGRVPPTSLRG